MRVRSIAALLSLALAVSFLAACSRSENTGSTSAETSASSEASPEVGATETATATETPSPGAEAQASGGAPAASETPTIPAEPTGLPQGWEKPYDRVADGPEAALAVRTGDINNLGFGWPEHFNPFSGNETPAHPYPCEPRPGAAPGTDKIMLGTSVTQHDIDTRPSDGYSHCSHRPDNLPEAIPLDVGALPAKFDVVLIQMFLDDFQAPVWNSHFQVSLNGTRIPQIEEAVNSLEQTGPIGKLVTVRLLPEYWPILRGGKVDVLFDDPTTGAPDGYAVDFVRLLVGPKRFAYAVDISATVVDADTKKPIAGAAVSAAQASATTGADGHAGLHGIPAGLVPVYAGAADYDSAVQLLDLPAGKHGDANFELKRHKEGGVADLRRAIAKNGSVAIYGIHFDTASARLRPDSLSSLQTILKLIEGDATSRWLIEGHTDNQGGAGYNLGLSNDRAKSVVTWLAQHGIAASRLSAKGYGLTRPVADNATAAGRALNRRVEVAPLK